MKNRLKASSLIIQDSDKSFYREYRLTCLTINNSLNMQKVILALLCMFFIFSEANSENKDLHPALKALDIKANVLSRKGTTGQLSVNIEITNTGDEQIIIPNMLPSLTANIYIKVYDNLDNLLIEQSEDLLDKSCYALNKGEDLKVSIPLYTQYRGVELANMIVRSQKAVMELYMYASFPSAKSFNKDRRKHMIIKEITVDPIYHSDEIAPYRDYIPKN